MFMPFQIKYGVDWAGLLANCDSDDDVHVPEIIISELDSLLLHLHVEPLVPCDDYGVNLYLRALNFVV